MRRPRLKRLFHSAFTRLLVIILAAGAAVTLTVMVGFFAIRYHSFSNLDRNVLLYAQYLASDLGQPPDAERAAQIARETGLIIRFDHPAGSWQTAAAPGKTALDRAWMRRITSGVWAGHYRGTHLIRINHDGGELTFISPRIVKDREEAGWLLLCVAAFLCVILTVAYFLIRRVLAPLRPLEAGVRELADGRLDHRVAAQGAEEFQDLAEAFNTMAGRIAALLSSKEHLLLDMSHELRSPLTRLKVQLEFVEDPEMQAALRADVAEMESMVTAILEEARLRSSTAALNLAPVDLPELTRSVAGEFSSAPPGVECGAMASAAVQADAEKLRMVMRNLMDNALKHSPKDGAPVAVSLARHEGAVELAVEDHGEGIPEAALPHLFEPFFRADSSRSRKTGGYGLGLSLCKAVVDAHRGRIDIRSTQGQGTRVVVTLPLDLSQ
jgi:signal transduction histidine kinase